MKKRILSLLLVVAMVLGIVPFSSVVANAEDTTTKNIELGTSGVADKDFVYFGNYNSEDIKWKVLDADADNTGAAQGMFLLSEYLLEQSHKQFDNNSNVWQGSIAQAWCKTFADSSAFTSAEKEALKSVNKTDETTNQYSISWGTSSLVDEKVFYLSAEEAANYIGANDGDEGLATTTSGGAAGGWWLRSPYNYDTSYAGFVYEVGYVDSYIVAYTYPGVRPAFNLNLESVLFSSAAEGGKSSGTVGAAALNSVSEYTSNTARAWKVTLLDSNRSFTAQAAEGTTASAATGYSNWSVNVTYNNAATGSNEYVSTMLCDASGNVLYYGNIAQNSASGTQTVNIPTGLGAGNYTLKVFSEQLNGDNKTDYASAMQDIALEVTLSKLATPSATFTATSENGGTLGGVTTNMQYSVDGGANWIDVTDATMNIADVTAANGVQIYDRGDGVATSDSDVQTITVTQAAQPTGLSKTDCSTAANNNGKISGVNNTMEYRVSGSADAWMAITGTTITGLSNQSYDIRVKASGTTLASDVQSIAISAYVAPPAPKAADYADVDKAISEIPADLSIYTDASVQALNDAKVAVDRNKTEAEQSIVDGYATAIRDAIKALRYKDADYSKVDTAIGKIPADLSIYTDASVKALNDAKNAVVRGKNITEQTTVDAYATAIQKAIDGLVKKTGATAKGNNNNATSAQTGDNSNMFLWLAILMLSAGGIVIGGITQKTRKKNSKQ
ncbi:DUF6273 domain-containing protein [Hespellia stercorisuis]|uniref:DUF6273 domain-containing protein n=1 Tax=Hespellia stercorisuis DSM 15480 TaxID=1121950 RepID=A0A1M6IIM0_9FIRM|nr:DUF6273 domain-containing protein [Hespellia stercorisuis]SHJ34247.1 hypothetical protein SAMN02745243_00353 [Hespellia stercorisuis DSM 15480]